MIIITKEEEVENYVLKDAANQSTLKDLADGLSSYLKKVEKRKEQTEIAKHLLIGSGVDILLTGNIERYKKEFHVSTLEKLPTETEKKIIDYAYSLIEFPENCDVFGVNSLDCFIKELKAAITEFKYYSNRLMETNINNLIESCSEYFKELLLSTGKNILSVQEDKIITDVVKSLKTHEVTKGIFDGSLAEREDIIVYFQLPLYFTSSGINCKGLLDIAIVKVNENKEATQISIIDLKTVFGETMNFPDSVSRFRYDIQAAFYYDGIQSEDVILPEGFPTITDKTIFNPFSFIVESTSEIGNPLLIKVSEDIIDMGRNGKRLGDGKRVRKGYKYLLEYYKYLVDNNWEHERLLKENNNTLTLTNNGFLEEDDY